MEARGELLVAKYRRRCGSADSVFIKASLMLAIQNRSFNDYFLMQSTNAIQPPEIIGNRVTGILFENKIDWATYFSDSWWCKQG